MASKPATDLPYNIEAEKACIGSALIDPNAVISVTSNLDEGDFYSEKHRIIYRAINILANEKRQTVDVVTITDQLLSMKELENIGGVPYLRECGDSMVSLGALPFYIKSVSDNSILRSMLTTMRNIDQDYRNQDITDINDFILSSENRFKTSIEKRRVSDFQSTAQMKDEMRRKIAEAKYGDENAITGLTTGYTRLNNLTSGFQPGEVTIIAARPSVGKTAFALNLAFRAATRGECTVGIFSLEMSKELLFKRLIASASSVSLKKINTGRLTDEEKMSLNGAINQVGDAKIYIDDTSGIRINDIMAKCRKLSVSNPDLGLIIIDYLGLISSSKESKNSDNRQEEVRKFSAALKGLALELHIPVVVLSQLSRDVEKRDSKKPMLSDLRDSGSIEQDADVVMLMYRSDYYPESERKKIAPPGREMAKYEEEQAKAPSLPGSASYVEINVAKNRNGQTGPFGLFFFKEFGRFEEPSSEWEEAYERLSRNL